MKPGSSNTSAVLTWLAVRALVVFVCVITVPFTTVVLAAQADSPSSGSPAAQDVPQFGIVPIGDFPEGFIADLPIAPGETIELQVAVLNLGDKPVDLRLFGTNAHVGINGGFQAGVSNEDPISLTHWMSIPEQILSVDGNDQQLVEFSISVPNDAEPGQYISAIVVETTEAFPVPGIDIFDQLLRYAMSVSVIVPGALSHSFELGAPVIEGDHLLIPIANTGNYLLRPEGEFVLINGSGHEVMSHSLSLGSIYGRYETFISIYLPEQLPPGEYLLTLELRDFETGSESELEQVPVELAESDDGSGVYLTDSSVEPNATEIVFANVSVALDNGGQQIDAANVILEVSFDGGLIDEFPLATNQVLLRGDNFFGIRYIPADMWEPGTYTFSLVVYAVDPNGGQQIELLNEDLDAEIVVP